jgi:hypothetical protein
LRPKLSRQNALTFSPTCFFLDPRLHCQVSSLPSLIKSLLLIGATMNNDPRCPFGHLNVFLLSTHLYQSKHLKPTRVPCLPFQADVLRRKAKEFINAISLSLRAAESRHKNEIFLLSMHSTSSFYESYRDSHARKERETEKEPIRSDNYAMKETIRIER